MDGEIGGSKFPKWIWVIVGVFAVLAIFVFMRGKSATTSARTPTTVTPTPDGGALADALTQFKSAETITADQLKNAEAAIAGQTNTIAALGNNLHTDEVALATQNGQISTLTASLQDAQRRFSAMGDNAVAIGKPSQKQLALDSLRGVPGEPIDSYLAAHNGVFGGVNDFYNYEQSVKQPGF